MTVNSVRDHSSLPWAWSSGLQGAEGDVEELRARLKQAESKSEDLAERVKSSTASIEQYRTMCLSLEEALEKEKQVTWIEQTLRWSELKQSLVYSVQYLR